MLRGWALDTCTCTFLPQQKEDRRALQVKRWRNLPTRSLQRLHGCMRMTFSQRFCIAPMMDWTDRHCRFFHRLLTRRALIYTEMITSGAVLHGDRARLLAYDP